MTSRTSLHGEGMTATTTHIRDEVVERPTKARWFNWWQAPDTGGVAVGPDGQLTPLDPGEIAPGPMAHPSHEIAVARALDLIDNDLSSGGECTVMKYLGAFPEGTRP